MWIKKKKSNINTSSSNPILMKRPGGFGLLPKLRLLVKVEFLWYTE